MQRNMQKYATNMQKYEKYGLKNICINMHKYAQKYAKICKKYAEICKIWTYLHINVKINKFAKYEQVSYRGRGHTAGV